VLGKFEHNLFVSLVDRVDFAIAKFDHLTVYGVGRRLITRILHYRLAFFVFEMLCHTNRVCQAKAQRAIARILSTKQQVVYSELLVDHFI